MVDFCACSILKTCSMALSGKLVTVEDQLTVGTVTYTQSLADDNERLRHKVATLEVLVSAHCLDIRDHYS
jgi:hypothetical protein